MLCCYALIPCVPVPGPEQLAGGAAPPPPHPHPVLGSMALLEDLQGDGGVLDSCDHAAVVQVEDVVLFLEHLQRGRVTL